LGSFSNIRDLKEKPIKIWQIKTACIKELILSQRRMNPNKITGSVTACFL